MKVPRTDDRLRLLYEGSTITGVDWSLVRSSLVNSKIKTRAELVKVLSEERLAGLIGRVGGTTIVTTNGCYDILHVGHVRVFQAAKEMGHLLVVGVNSDASVRANKGENRPLFPEADRAEVVAALGCVDYVTIFDEPHVGNFLEAVRPDIHVKGADYADPKRKSRSRDLLESWGGEMRYVPLSPGVSTSALIEQIVRRFGQE